MNKKCAYCKEVKPLSEYFQAPQDAAQSWHGTSEYCKECHGKGYIKHGYGSYSDRYTSPEDCK